MTHRVYLPLVISDLARVASSGTVPLRATVHGVTTSDRLHHPGVDEEELEFDAMCAALDAADDLRSTKEERRVVVAADVPSVDEADALTVRLAAEVPLSEVVSVHCEESAGTAPGEGYDDLLWYDVSELDEIVDPGA